MEGLGISLPLLLTQIVNFAILFGLLYLVAYKPIIRIFDERSRRIKEGMEQAEQIKERAARAEEKVKLQLEAAGKQGQEQLARAARTGEELRQNAQQQARKDADSLLERARTEIQQERDAAVDELRREFADLTVLAAGKIIDRSLDKKAHRQIIDKVLKESTSLRKG